MDSLLTAFTDPTALAALVALVVMEVVLGIDNLVFISILTNKLPEHQRQKARRIGIGLALGMRLVLLSITGSGILTIFTIKLISIFRSVTVVMRMTATWSVWKRSGNHYVSSNKCSRIFQQGQ